MSKCARSADGEARRVAAVKDSFAKRRRLPLDNGDGTFTVPLTKGYEALISAEDVAEVSLHNWKAVVYDHGVYAGRTTRAGLMLMHRQLMRAERGQEVDHADTVTLNNTRANLRLATSSQNKCNRRLDSRNTSGFKGVGWSNQTGKWYGRVQLNGRQYHAGFHDTPEAAYAARCALAERLHGEFARHA